MNDQLSDLQVNNLLSSHAIGRIACTDGTLPYIVPVTYFFDGEFIYGQTKEGMKLELLRKNPNVSFEVDQVTDMANWQSVVVAGKFEELTGVDAEKAMEKFFDRHFSLTTISAVHPHEHENDITFTNGGRIKPIVYRIRINKKSGRFEKR
jgi:uncharacterized protein